MAINYGNAQAGTLTIDHYCTLPICSGGDGVLWWKAGVAWASFARSMIKLLLAKVPPAEWPPDFAVLGKTLSDAAATFDGSQPILYFEQDIVSYVQAQQVLRDGAGQIATFLEAKGVKVGGAPNTSLPPQKNVLEGLLPSGGTVLVGLGLIAAIMIFRK